MQIRVFFLLILFTKSVVLNAQSNRLSKENYNDYFQKNECHKKAFEYALRGYHLLQKDSLLHNSRYVTIVDFTRSSNHPRLFVLDMKLKKLALKSITAHGAGSDPDSTTIPYRFGNKEGSKMSSLGFYITGNTYANHRPDDSLGLCLFGLDKGFNDSAAAREVVIHYGASEHSGHVYVNDWGAARSYGCPALPLSTNTRIINLIKGGSCLFIYSSKIPDYPKKSTVLNRRLHKRIIQQGPPPNNCRCDLTRF